MVGNKSIYTHILGVRMSQDTITVEGVEIDPHKTNEGWEVCNVCDRALWNKSMSWGSCIREEDWWKDNYPHANISPMMVCKECLDIIDNGESV